MKKAILIVTVAVLGWGCQTLVKPSWRNFKAYYNTYYNAKKVYRAGLDQVENQPLEIDPEQPYRIHQPPTAAGNEEFAKAIDKGAQILRKHPESKYVDESLLLIGKSYYYREEFYSALQKFEELYANTDSPHMKQLSVIWKGITLLDLKLYDRGTGYLKSEIGNSDLNWDPAHKAEAGIVLAEHYAQQGEWEHVAGTLSEFSISFPIGGDMQAGANFLYGQSLEQLDRYGEAYYAYASIHEYFPPYSLRYQARKKQGDVLRQLGNYSDALALFREMMRDDKNIDREAELNLEIGITYQQNGNLEAAKTRFNEVLHSSDERLDSPLQAQAYFRLGTIYSEHEGNYNLASAYFDSSAMIRNQATVTENVRQLSRAYGRYTLLRNQLQHSDSLLYLGNLSPEERDSVINEIRSVRLQQLQDEDRGRDNLLVNITEARDQQGTTSQLYGFLNYRNNELVAESKSRFRALWGDRPLVDNWRRIEVVRSITVERNPQREQQDRSGRFSGETLDQTLNIDLEEIPTTRAKKRAMEHQAAAAKYELGNLFFLTLQKPDSAAYYFRSVVTDHPRDSLVPKAIYSLVELYQTTGDSVEAGQWARRLKNEYPKSRYTRLLSGESDPVHSGGYTLRNELRKRGLSEYSGTTTIPDPAGYAEELRQVALTNSSVPGADRLHFNAVRFYAEAAREQTDSTVLNEYWNRRARPDSMESDTAGYTIYHPFTGALWDSTRILLKEFREQFTGSAYGERVDALAVILNTADRRTPVKCAEIGTALRVDPGMHEFVQSITIPQDLDRALIPDQVRVRVVVDESGRVLTYDILESKLPEGVKNALGRVIMSKLRFYPVEHDGRPVAVSCEITIPLDG